MPVDLSEKYPHIRFERSWIIDEETALMLGQCEAYSQAICNTPILPKYNQQLYSISMIKGAKATTAIEGNTLTEDEIKALKEGDNLPPSKQYQQIEVTNILHAFDKITNMVLTDHVSHLISPQLIKDFHKMVGEGLDTSYFPAQLGQFRQSLVTVGGYQCPDYVDVEELINRFCEWLKLQFKYEDGNHALHDTIIQAIVTHVYLELIHPFGDGNGRTGRLLEFYILLRGKSPNIASHILANHYNDTRPQYYAELTKVTSHRSLTGFVKYAIGGFRDGLEKTLRIIQQNQIEITWKHYVFEMFEQYPTTIKEAVRKRRRNLVLELPPGESYTSKEVVLATPKIARDFATLSDKQVERELNELVQQKLLIKNGNKFTANVGVLRQGDNILIYTK